MNWICKKSAIAQLLIRKLGSFIRLWRVILLRSDIRLATSGIRYASFIANKISRKPKAFISLSRKRQYHSDEVGISLLLFLPICVIMRVRRRAGACSRRNEKFGLGQRRHQGTALQGVWALPEAIRCLQRCNTKAKLAINIDKAYEYSKI